MEFVEGETLERLIKRSGRLEIKLALEITTQVAAGLAAVDEQNLVHRGIKPSNIMVRLKDGGAATVKIIDLGLAKLSMNQVFKPRSQCPEALPVHRSLQVQSSSPKSA
jgi:serine/threonine protein kinase